MSIEMAAAGGGGAGSLSKKVELGKDGAKRGNASAHGAKQRTA